MIKLHENGAFVKDGLTLMMSDQARDLDRQACRQGSIAWRILQEHNTSNDPRKLRLRFDSLTSHDITYVGIIQTARASGMTEFPVPYVMTNCHNSLCAVGGTINEDDHKFALSAAKKYGGVYVPTNQAVIHSYNREVKSAGGRMILGSDSHTRYGALGTMAIGEGGGELAKQLVKRTYDLDCPEVVGVFMTGKPRHGVGPHDVAIALVTAVFDEGFVKNRVLEFVGPGIEALPVEYRNGIDVMTTETTCLSSIWRTDEQVREYYRNHGRENDFKQLDPAEIVFYDRLIEMDLGEVEPMIALPFHPSKGMPIREFKQNAKAVLTELDELTKKNYPALHLPSLLNKLDEDGFHVDQAIIAGCAGGTFDNVALAANILEKKSTGNGQFTFSVYPGSMPINYGLMRAGVTEKLLAAGAILREAFCGPCFGAGDTPATGEFSIRHTTRNFPNREGSKPGEGQLSYVALMDARSIAATAANKGILTGGDEIDYSEEIPEYHFDKGIYEKRVYNAYGNPDPRTELVMGPNIKDWPEIPSLKEHLLVKVVSSINDPVTTTDELMPSGETSSFRSNPLRLAEFTLSRRDPEFVGRAKAVYAVRRLFEKDAALPDVVDIIDKMDAGVSAADVTLGSAIYANKPGDGSAREQAASGQRVLGASANFAKEYATKRYRSNLINWGMMPFLVTDALPEGAYVLVKDLRRHLKDNELNDIEGYLLKDKETQKITLKLGELTEDERNILQDGCLINYYKR